MADRWDVFLEGLEPGASREDAAARIAEAFGIDVDVAAQIVARAPMTVKRALTTDVAERYFHALRKAGTRVRLVKRAGDAGPISDRPPGHPASLAPPPAWRTSNRPPARDPGFAPAAVGVAVASTPPPATSGPYRAPGSIRSPAPSKAKGSFVAALVTSFAYPLQAKAIPVLLGVALVALLASYVPFVGGILSGGIVLGYLFSVIRASANGEHELPFGADFTDVEDFVAPIVRFYLAILVCLVPALVVWRAAPAEAPWYANAIIAAAAVGLSILPASIVTAAHSTGCFGPLNPIPAVQIVFRIPGPYVLVTLAVAAVTALDAGFVIASAPLFAQIPVPIVPSALQATLGLYLPLVSARMLGLLIYHYEDELGLG